MCKGNAQLGYEFSSNGNKDHLFAFHGRSKTVCQKRAKLGISCTDSVHLVAMILAHGIWNLKMRNTDTEKR